MKAKSSVDVFQLQSHFIIPTLAVDLIALYILDKQRSIFFHGESER